MLILHPDFAAEIGHQDNVFDYLMTMQGDVYREMDGRRTVRFELGGKGYFLKAHSGVGWREIFKNLLQLRLPVIGAANEWKAILRLHELGIDTMTLVGYGKLGISPASQRSFVITEELSGTRSLEQVFADPEKGAPGQRPEPATKREYIKRIAEIARVLHHNGVNHRDFYLCHFLLRSTGNGVQRGEERPALYLIDLHRAQLRSKVPVRWVIKDLAALYFSSMDIGLTRRDLFRFLMEYQQLPLRQILREETGFWRKVTLRAEALHKSWHAVA